MTVFTYNDCESVLVIVHIVKPFSGRLHIIRYVSLPTDGGDITTIVGVAGATA